MKHLDLNEMQNIMQYVWSGPEPSISNQLLGDTHAAGLHTSSWVARNLITQETVSRAKKSYYWTGFKQVHVYIAALLTIARWKQSTNR